MPDFRIRASGEIITDLIRAFPHVSIPQPPTAADLDVLDVDPVMEGAQPALTRFQSAARSGPEQDTLGNWVWVYTAVDWDQDAIDAATASQWDVIRTDRNARLSASDWTQLADVPLSEEEKAAWATYRQALRDVTTQVDPFEITWPVAP